MKELTWSSLENLALPVKALLPVTFSSLVWAADGGWPNPADPRHGGRQTRIVVDDLVYSYYGNRGGSKLEAKLNGSMKDYAPGEARLELIK